MQISVLADNHSGANTKAEHGLSYLIEYDEMKLLFDTGQSDLFLKNAQKMSIFLNDIDMIILSHGHFDHGNGLDHIPSNTLLCHPGCFVKRQRNADRSYIGLSRSKEELSDKFEIIASARPYKISEKIIFLGEIPRLTGFESQSTSFIFEDGKPDYVADDSALALVLSEGLFVVTGCGHAGVVNTLEYAKKVSGTELIHGIMGGFHLKDNNSQTKETIRYLKENRIKHVLPSHCTDLPALSAFYESFGNPQVKTGDVFCF
jgi:7,8-dihydropterin-6-yl-methyl-4-(beta-D-ribofuranosyl)aminobenzene 5'-phosphate synthase